MRPGVRRIQTARDDACFVVDGDDGLTLVDVGWKSSPAKIADALGPQVRDVRRIVLTHAHPDHVRGLAEMKATTGATVLVHRADAPWLAGGRVPRGGRSGSAGAVLDAVPLLHWTPVTADVLLEGDEVLDGGLRVIHTPGHSPGHVVLHHQPSGSLLMGDAVFHRGSPSLGPGLLAHDPQQRVSSLRKLPTDVEAVGFAHGSPLVGAEVETYQAWVGKMTS